MVRVASLLRLSSKKQVARQGGDDQDIPGQRESIARFLETKSDWKLVKEYVEAAVSAYKKGRSERDKLMDAIRDAEDGKYDVLVVWKGDRLSRRIEDFPGIVKDLTEEIGVEVWSVADELGGKRWSARNALEMLMLSIEGFKNQSESENISVRTREKKRQMREAGQWTGGHVPFGYQLIAKKDAAGEPVMLGGRAVRELVLHPENSGVVRALYQRYAGGTGFLSLTRWLNETGVPTQNGGLWLTATVRQILRNPFYAGYGTSRTYRVDTPARGNHPAIIPDDLWQEVRRMREARSSLPRRQQSTDYTLTGVLYCGVCGHTMGGTWFKSGSGDQVYRYQVYRCLSFRCGRYCGNRNHRVEDIEAAFIDELEQRLGQPSELRTLLEEQSAAAASRLEEYEAGRRRTLNRIKEIDQALQRVKRAYFEADTLTDQEYAATKAEYTAERQRLENEFSRPAPAAEVRDLSGLAEQVRQIRANWAYLTPEERKTFALNITKGYGLKAIVMPDKSVRLEAE